MTTLHRVPMLRITQCPDSMRWYRDLVGQLVPHRSWTATDGFVSAEPAGFVNYVRTEDAQPTEVLVSAEDLQRWPYAQVRHKSVRIIHRTRAKTCAASCNAMGICQALEDCQDKPRIDAQLAKPAPTTSQAAPMGQSRAHSMAETLASIAVGFVVWMALQALVLPAMGHHITLAENFWITCIFTVASVLRGYGMRRFFNHLHTRSAP